MADFIVNSKLGIKSRLTLSKSQEERKLSCPSEPAGEGETICSPTFTTFPLEKESWATDAASSSGTLGAIYFLLDLLKVKLNAQN